MTRRDWLLLAIGDRLQPIQIQKTLFKFSKEAGAPLGEVYEFTPYNWGPCSFEIYDDLQQLREDGLIESVPTSRGWNVYRTTRSGIEVGNRIRKKADSRLLGQMVSIREWVVARSFPDLLKDVYRDYPDYATQSLFTER